MKFYRLSLNKLLIFSLFFCLIFLLIQCNQNRTAKDENNTAKDSLENVSKPSSAKNINAIDTKFDILYLTNAQLQILATDINGKKRSKFIFKFFHYSTIDRLTMTVWTAQHKNQGIGINQFLNNVIGPTNYLLDISSYNIIIGDQQRVIKGNSVINDAIKAGHDFYFVPQIDKGKGVLYYDITTAVDTTHVNMKDTSQVIKAYTILSKTDPSPPAPAN